MRRDPDGLQANYPPTEGQRRALYALCRKLACPLPSVRTVTEASRELRRLGRMLQTRPPTT
jgi:hypothetical protein